jgi:dTMP kinase
VASRGRLLALEGIDGSGKSTQAKQLAQVFDAVLTFEPGATELGVSLRHTLLSPELPPVSTRAEALLMAADRAEHIARVIEPALSAGRWVVTDRFSGSTLAYQGYGRGIPLAELSTLIEWATDGLQPDLTILVDVPVEVAAARMARSAPDRFEKLGLPFAARVREGFLALAAADPTRWVVVDGTEKPASLSTRIVDSVRTMLGDR